MMSSAPVLLNEEKPVASESPPAPATGFHFMPVLTFGVMAVVIAFIGGILFWAILSETELCKQGMDAALASPADINHPAALAYTRAMVAAYTKTFSILLSFLLMFAGAIYILLPNTSVFKADLDHSGIKGALATNSPGLVIASLGMLLAMTAVLTPITMNYEETVTPGPAQTDTTKPVEPAQLEPDPAAAGVMHSVDAPVKEPPPEH